MNLYPLKFAPILKEMIWGGTLLQEVLGKPSPSGRTGESWEISGLPESVSVVANGAYAGLTLNEVIAVSPDEVLGAANIARTGAAFPLLIKFIDACDDLSIQVHPNDEQAKPFGSAGKTEMWYVLRAERDAALISGLSQPVTEQEYVRRVQDGTLTDVLQRHRVSGGDVFFIPAGRIHAIGKGILLLEIQQSSNITYRIFDYNRRDANGVQRPLHTEQAKSVINYADCEDTKLSITRTPNIPVNIAQCPYFTANVIEMTRPVVRSYGAGRSFVILICTRGSAVIHYGGKSTGIAAGETALLPAALSAVTLAPNGEAEIVETYVLDF